MRWNNEVREEGERTMFRIKPEVALAMIERASHRGETVEQKTAGNIRNFTFGDGSSLMAVDHPDGRVDWYEIGNG